MTTALNSVLPGLGDELRAATAAKQRAAAVAAAQMAIMRMGLQDQRIDAGIAAVAAGHFGPTSEREGLQAMTDELDEVAWGIQERVHRGEADDAKYLSAFRRARACSALFFALGDDPTTAALEGIYEAHHAIGDAEALLAVVEDVLSGRLRILDS